MKRYSKIVEDICTHLSPAQKEVVHNFVDTYGDGSDKPLNELREFVKRNLRENFAPKDFSLYMHPPGVPHSSLGTLYAVWNHNSDSVTVYFGRKRGEAKYFLTDKNNNQKWSCRTLKELEVFIKCGLTGPLKETEELRKLVQSLVDACTEESQYYYELRGDRPRGRTVKAIQKAKDSFQIETSLKGLSILDIWEKRFDRGGRFDM